MKHTFLYKVPPTLTDGTEKFSQYSMPSYVIIYDDSSVHEEELIGYVHTSWLTWTIGQAINEHPDREFFVYSDDFTKEHCLKYMEELSEPYENTSAYTPLNYEREVRELKEHAKRVIEKVHFHTFIECPETTYCARINTLFEHSNPNLPRHLKRPTPFRGSRNVYDSAVIGFLNE